MTPAEKGKMWGDQLRIAFSDPELKPALPLPVAIRRFVSDAAWVDGLNKEETEEAVTAALKGSWFFSKT
jgi:hypothetical protein